MTMFPAQNLSKRHRYGGYGGGYWESFGGVVMSGLEEGYECCSSEAAYSCLGSGSTPVLVGTGLMAEDESRTETSTVNNETGSTSKNNNNNNINIVVDHDHDVRDESGWLQLGIGGDHHHHHQHMTTSNDQTAGRSAGLMELDLLPAGDGSRQGFRSLDPIFHVPDFRPPLQDTSITSASLYLQHPGTSSVFPQQEINNWAFRPIPRHITAASSSSSSSRSSLMMPPGAYFTGPFQLHAGVDVARPSLDFRVVDPPRRPHSGLWFMLQASPNQTREPSLPQIPKSYLRIKDGRMTVGLLMKYLVMKLRLNSESEIEITCRGQPLLPFLTLQHVRDNIWSPRNIVTLLPDSSTADHVMVLQYGRSA
ncbi:protein LAX PANICLE 2-like [Cornus florida]|uniref:protein LAX PANICLE 2-like n=1 Tax=Cornus florida TaxID=4283 RepID=UPI00289E510B|nr:protein LAX PANICLE 2-like [Cornus florida]